MELKINDDVFNDLKENKEPLKLQLHHRREMLTPSSSNKLNNLLKEINHSQSMTLNDSLNFELHKPEKTNPFITNGKTLKNGKNLK